MKTIKYIWVAVIFLMIGCQEESHAPKPSGEAPAPLKNYSVTNIHGAADIYFELDDERASYVLAEYEPVSGLIKQAKASRFSDSLRLEGFANEGEYDVLIYTVNETEKKSEPVSIKVNPLEPPYKLAYNTLKVGPAFGGISASFTNIERADLTLEVLRKNNSGEWDVIERENNNNENVSFVARGYDPEKREFGFYIRDRWSNFSDTLYQELTPYEENLIDMSNFYETNFPTDSYEGHLTGGRREISFLFDGLFTQQRSWYTPPNSGIPMHFTIYLQDKYQLSRLKLWQRGGNSYYYQAANVKTFEVYGSNDPNPDGTWESWTLLKSFENIKPSGQPLGDNSDLDNETAAAGEDYEFDLDTPPVKYLRIKILDTWGNQTFMYISEMEIYGAKSN